MSGPSFDQRDGVIWYDGRMVPWTDANLHVLSHGLHYASAVFEGERAYGGVIYKLDEHTRRLHESARLLDFEIPYSVEEVNEACNAVLREQGFSDAYVRPIAWRGSEMMGVSAQHNTIHLAIAVWNGRPISIRPSAPRASGSILPSSVVPTRAPRRASRKPRAST
jgi:branched-chain amino acid aminotransferase